MVRENRWGFWHPYLPFLGDEMTGKTIAIIGTGRIGQAMAKKCSGFDMNILCCQTSRPNEKFVAALQAVMDLRHLSGLQRERTSIRYGSLEDALRLADFVSIHVPLVREGEGKNPTYPSAQRDHSLDDETDCVPGQYVAWSGDRRICAGTRAEGGMDRRALPSTYLKLNRFRPIRRCAIRSWKIGFGCIRISAVPATDAAVDDPNGGMAGRCVQGLIDVLEGNYGGDIQKMPFVVNKEAFR